MSAQGGFRRAPAGLLALAGITVAAGTISLAYHVSAVLSAPELATQLISTSLWQEIVAALRGSITARVERTLAQVPLEPIVAATALFSLAVWLLGGFWISRRRGISFAAALCLWSRAWLWWLLPVAWEILGTMADLARWSSAEELWRGTLPFWESALWAGWLTHLFVLGTRPAPHPEVRKDPARVPRALWIAVALYFVCFGGMNWLLYEGLLVPHGDSAMYEEHLWNVLHGKGFRSYLDRGRLFLGEHVQVIHLLAIPLYLVWPSQVLLELCQSACLALGAVPVFRIAQRHSRSSQAALFLALAYLLYFPMQYLDIAADFKTFRPNSFEVPLLLMALDALERKRYRTFVAWLGMTLLCQEDAAVVIAPLGIWIALRLGGGVRATQASLTPPPDWDRAGGWRTFGLGAGLAVFGVAYTLAVIKLVLPWFRGGADVHFAQYFADLGSSSSEIALNVLRHPGLVAGKLCGVESVIFALGLLAPLGFLPLLSPGRLAVAAPLFGVLCLSEITNSPLHHFHAPLIPVLFWAAAAGLPNAITVLAAVNRFRRRNRADPSAEEKGIPPDSFVPSGKVLPAQEAPEPVRGSIRGRQGAAANVAAAAALWALFNSAFCGAPLTLSPLGIGFWDAGSRAYWRKLYVPGERARRFPAVLALIPRESRVASTDYIHPRFTHYERSYDYSLYSRNPDNSRGVPDDTGFIVIDTRHPYSRIQRPDQVEELQNEPDRWEVLDDHTGGYFIVLKRRRLPNDE